MKYYLSSFPENLITLRVVHLSCMLAYHHIEEPWELRYDQEDYPGEMSRIDNKNGRSCSFLGNMFFFFLIKSFWKEDESMCHFNICGVFNPLFKNIIALSAKNFS